jgi:hypothetical protein
MLCMLELYQDSLMGLLLPRNDRTPGVDLEINKDADTGMVSVPGAVLVDVASHRELMEVIAKGQERAMWRFLDSCTTFLFASQLITTSRARMRSIVCTQLHLQNSTSGQTI